MPQGQTRFFHPITLFSSNQNRYSYQLIDQSKSLYICICPVVLLRRKCPFKPCRGIQFATPRALSCLALPCLAFVLSCLALSCLVFSCLVLSNPPPPHTHHHHITCSPIINHDANSKLTLSLTPAITLNKPNPNPNPDPDP
jgi:hypothetical protein